MQDVDWKIKVETSLAEIKRDIKYIREKLPSCEKEAMRQGIRLNRKLIFVIIVTYIPLFIYFFTNK